MKVVSILIALFLITPLASANWYVVNIDNEVIAKCDYQPDTKDLESRDEIAVFSEEDIELIEVEYRGNKIKKHIKTASEIQEEEAKQVERERHSLIMERMVKIAETKLIAEGLISE